MSVHEQELPGIGRKFEILVGKGDRIDVVERFLPETWAISGNTIAYLDINRQPKIYRLGVRTQVSKEAGIKAFDLYPGALTYRSNSGVSKVCVIR